MANSCIDPDVRAAALRAVELGATVAAVVKRYEVSARQVDRWREAGHRDAVAAFAAHATVDRDRRRVASALVRLGGVEAVEAWATSSGGGGSSSPNPAGMSPAGSTEGAP